MAPDLRGVRIESENAFAVDLFDKCRQPGRRDAAPGQRGHGAGSSSTPRLSSPTETAEKRSLLARGGDSLEKGDDASNSPWRRFRASLITLVSIKYMRRGFGRLDPLEIRVEADVGH